MRTVVRAGAQRRPPTEEEVILSSRQIFDVGKNPQG